jgi:secondary thiamine-phosphate synthase enzyme
VKTTEIEVVSRGRGVRDLTDEVRSFCRDVGDGLLNVFAPHATAGVGLMELGSGSEDDLVALLDRLMPRSERYRHQHGAAGHGADHLLPILVSPSMVLPVVNGRPALGTWQSVVLVDLNTDNPRRHVRLTFVPG